MSDFPVFFHECVPGLIWLGSVRYDNNNNNCSTTIPATVVQSLAFALFRYNAYPVSSQGCEFSSRAPLPLRPSRPCSCCTHRPHETSLVLPPRPCSPVPPSFQLRCCGQERGHDIFSIVAEVLMGFVRVLPCVPPELYFVTSYHMHIRVVNP